MQDHFENHRDEFGYETADEYLDGARDLFEREDVETFYRKRDGATLFYDEETNEFGVLNKDGTIGSYYRPDEGIYYWQSQIKEK